MKKPDTLVTGFSFIKIISFDYASQATQWRSFKFNFFLANACCEEGKELSDNGETHPCAIRHCTLCRNSGQPFLGVA